MYPNSVSPPLSRIPFLPPLSRVLLDVFFAGPVHSKAPYQADTAAFRSCRERIRKECTPPQIRRAQIAPPDFVPDEAIFVYRADTRQGNSTKYDSNYANEQAVFE